MSDNLLAVTESQLHEPPPARFTRFTTDGALLTKSISLEDGRLKKVACAQPRSATAELCEVHGLEELATVLHGLQQTQALVYGVMVGRTTAHVVTDARRRGLSNAISRTRQLFQFAAQPGVMMFDHDGMQEGRSIDPDELHALLIAAIPPLANVRMLWRPSVSSGILGPDGTPLTGVVGQRFYLLVEDASLIPQAGEAVSDLLWAAGHGWIDVGKAGQKLQRSPVDKSVWQPERLDFAAAPVLKAPLTRAPAPWRIFGKGAERLDLRRVIVHADGAVKRSATRNLLASLHGAEAESSRARALWVQEQAPRMAKARCITEMEAGAVLERASSKQTLLGNFELLAEDGTRVTVAELLADRDRWHGARFADPLEPDYRGDHRVAWANLKSGGPPYIFSHAHGGCTYRLARELRTIEVREGERPRIVDECLDVLRRGGEVFELANQPLATLSRIACRELHAKLTTERGPATANRVVKTLRAVYRSAARVYESLPTAPTVAVKFHKMKRRRSPIAWAELPSWWATVESLKNPVRRDLQRVLLFTGLRSTDGKTIRWEHIDFEAGTLHRPKPKGGEDRAFTIPLCAYVLAILKRRKEENEQRFPGSPWVFPVHRRKQLVSHIVEVDEQRIVDGKHLRGFLPSPHRLRDTFLSAAHDCGVSPLDQKALANHALPSSDITEGYIRPGLEHLREVAEKIAAFLLGKAGQRSAVLTIVRGEVG